MNLSINFTLDELIQSEYAIRNNIKEQFTPSEEIVSNLKDLCIHILQPVRDYLKKPLTITCGYRCPRVNTGVGGATNSQHMVGQAADVKYMIDGKVYNKVLLKAIVDLNLPFDQIIYEFGDDTNPAWVHVSYDKNRSRKQILRAIKIGRKTVYETYNP